MADLMWGGWGGGGGFGVKEKEEPKIWCRFLGWGLMEEKQVGLGVAGQGRGMKSLVLGLPK